MVVCKRVGLRDVRAAWMAVDMSCWSGLFLSVLVLLWNCCLAAVHSKPCWSLSNASNEALEVLRCWLLRVRLHNSAREPHSLCVCDSRSWIVWTSMLPPSHTAHLNPQKHISPSPNIDKYVKEHQEQLCSAETTNWNTKCPALAMSSTFSFNFCNVVMFVVISSLCCSCWMDHCFVLQISTLRQQGRTLYPTVPENAEREARSLFVQEVSRFKGPQNTLY